MEAKYHLTFAGLHGVVPQGAELSKLQKLLRAAFDNYSDFGISIISLSNITF
jgi:hypothetical protein